MSDDNVGDGETNNEARIVIFRPLIILSENRSATHLAEEHPKPSKPKFKPDCYHLWRLVFALWVLTIFGYQYFAPKQPSPFSIGEVTRTNLNRQPENSLAFIRLMVSTLFSIDTQKTFCTNNIWAKDTTTQQEFQLNKELRLPTAAIVSPKMVINLVFVKTGGCSKPDTVKKML